MKKFKLSILFLLFAIVGFSTTIPVVDPGDNNDIASNFNTAVSASVDGDIVELPAGIFKVSGTVNIAKWIEVKGQGIGNTILYRDEALSDASLLNIPMIQFTINSRTSCGVKVWGIELRSQRPLFISGDGGSLASDIGIKMIKATDFIIYDCKFKYFGSSGVEVRHYDDVSRGVIYNCVFDSCAKGTDGLGLGYGVVVYGEALTWISNDGFGTNNFIFIEDCIFNRHRHSFASAGCGRAVFRYNSVFQNFVGGAFNHALDSHSAREGQTGVNRMGTRTLEVYGNTFTNTMIPDAAGNTRPLFNGMRRDSISERCIGIRSGSAVVYDNNINGYRFGVGILSEQVSSYGYPGYQQTGWSSGKNLGPTHTGEGDDEGDGDLWVWDTNYTVWDVVTAGGSHSNTVAFYNYGASGGTTSTYFTENREYHLGEKLNYNRYPYPFPNR